jgi:stearoyl-CoA desaturase (delta-9 desaturase)
MSGKPDERRADRAGQLLHQSIAVVLLVVGPFAAVLYAAWVFWAGWLDAREAVLFAVFYVATGLGITLGFHRLLTHESFRTGPVVKGTFLVLGSMANQGRCIDWAAHHLRHHGHSDQEGDPHSPLDGLLHAHVGWIVTGSPAQRERYCKHLLRDPVVLLIDRTWALWVTLGLLVPYLVAGWRGLVWAGLVRMVVVNHLTFSVNSICHTFGRRSFETKDRSRNNWLVALLSLGEGWHNNHHAFPRAAYHGMTRWQLDFTGTVIRLLVRARLAWDVRLPPPALVERRRLRPSRSGIVET